MFITVQNEVGKAVFSKFVYICRQIFGRVQLISSEKTVREVSRAGSLFTWKNAVKTGFKFVKEHNKVKYLVFKLRAMFSTFQKGDPLQSTVLKIRCLAGTQQ